MVDIDIFPQIEVQIPVNWDNSLLSEYSHLQTVLNENHDMFALTETC